MSDNTKSEGFGGTFQRPGIAAAYKYFEQITAIPAEALLSESGLLSSSTPSPLVILDNACGTGIVASLLYGSPALEGREMSVLCGDLSPEMVAAASKRIETEGWKSAKAQVVDAQDTKLPDDHFTHVLTNFAIFALPNPTAALKECLRIAKPGGSIAFTTWNTLGWVEDVKETFSRIPGAPPFLDLASMWRSTGMWDDPAWVHQQLVDLGFTNVKTQLLEFRFTVQDAKVYVESFKAMMVPQLTGRWDEQDKKEKAPLIVPELEKVLAEKYGEGKPFDLRNLAVIASGNKPE